MTIISTNLLTGISNITAINSFVYNLSAKPSGTTAVIQFSQNGSAWYSSAGVLDASNTLTTGVDNSIDLSGLIWSGANFYYKTTFTTNSGTSTPVMDDIKVNYSTPSSVNDTVTRSTAATDLSGVANITYWVRSTVAGSYATFGFGESVATEQSQTITINQANTWEQKSFDITGITGTQRDAVTKYMILFQGDTGGASFYFDDIQTNALFAPTLGTATSLTSSSIRWNFTDNSSEETGFKIYDESSNLLVTCATANLTSCDETGLTPNTQYTRKIGTYNASSTSIASGTVSGYTLAVVPSVPTVNTRTTTTVNVNPDPGTNAAATTMAIYKETGTTCDGSGGSYIAANGSDNGSTAVWQTDATWSTVTVTGLTSETAYSFCVKAKNAENVETAFSSVGQNDSGYIPLSGNFVITANTSILNKYIDASDSGRYVMGVDSGTGNLNTAVLNLQSGILTVNANETVVAGSFSLSGGSIAVATNGGQLKPGSALWAIDADDDGYSSNTKLYYGGRPGPVGKRKSQVTTLSTADCDDGFYATNNVCCTVATRYQDADGDTYGNPSVSISACTTAGYVDNNTDCNDASASLFRSVAGYLDSDGDGYGAGAYTTCVGATGSYVASGADCYDSNVSAYPGSGACSASHRGDGSYDYNCSGGNTGCGTSFNYVYSVEYTYACNGGWSPNGTAVVYSPGGIACGVSNYGPCTGTNTLQLGCNTRDDGGSEPGSNPPVCVSAGGPGTQACQ